MLNTGSKKNYKLITAIWTKITKILLYNCGNSNKFFKVNESMNYIFKNSLLPVYISDIY